MRQAGCLVLLLLLVPTAMAADSTVGPGRLYLPDALVVGEGETLRLAPGTTLTGPGHVDVRGRLLALGTPDARIVSHVPLLFQGGNTSILDHVDVTNVSGAALTVHAANLTVRNATFAENRAGIVVDDASARITFERTTIQDHASAGLRLDAFEEARLNNVTLSRNAIGLQARLQGQTESLLRVTGATFTQNPAHAWLDYGAQPALRSTVTIEDSHWVAGTLVMTSDVAPTLAGDKPPRVSLRNNTFTDSDVALSARGAGYLVESRDDAYLGNRIGISLAAATLTLEGARFQSSGKDIDATPDARLTTAGVTFTQSGAAPSAGPWLYVVPALLVGLAGVAVWSRRPPKPPRTEQTTRVEIETPDAPDPEPAPFETTEVGARILRDVTAHPASPQSDVARRLGLSRQALHYHVKKLVEQGALTKTSVGRTTELRVAPGIRPPPLPPTVTQPDLVEKA